jgi:hypothetical protein
LSCGKAIGFGKLPSDTPKPTACNCHMCFYFSFWSLYRWPCTCSFDEEFGGQCVEARLTSKPDIGLRRRRENGRDYAGISPIW